MILRRKIDKESYDSLGAEIQSEYVKKGGEYILNIEQEEKEDTSALKSAKDWEVKARQEAEKRARVAEEKLAELSNNDAKKRGDIDTLEKSWNDKAETQKAEYEAKLAVKDKFIAKTLVDNVAQQLATKLSTSPALLTPHIKSRLTVDLDGDTPVTKVLDAQGRISASTINDLEKEIVDNKDFSAIIIANKSKGGSAPSSIDKLGSANYQSNRGNDQRLLSELPGKELAAVISARIEQSNNEQE